MAKMMTATALEMCSTHRRPSSSPVRVGYELGDLPRGSITEVLGGVSAGRTALLHRWITASTRAGEATAILDFSDAFDPYTARAAGTDLGKLLWIRMARKLDVAFRVTDIVLQGGGFGLVVLDLSDAPQMLLQRVPTSYWHRFRQTIEDTSTILAVAGQQVQARSCATRQIEMQSREPRWTGREPARLFAGLRVDLNSRKPVLAETQSLWAAA